MHIMVVGNLASQWPRGLVVEEHIDEALRSDPVSQTSSGRQSQDQQRLERLGSGLKDERGEAMSEDDASPPSYEQSCNDRGI